MVVAVKRHAARALLRRVGHAALLLPAGAWALGAAAPFTPPAPPHAAASAASDAEGGAVPAPTVAAGLSGVRLGSRPLALIDGQWLAPGATVRGARLVAVQADAVQLRGPDGELQRLALTPQVELRPVGPAPILPGAATPARPSPKRQP